ncbi:MAG: OadG family protein [Lachnospiraceae bacterium]
MKMKKIVLLFSMIAVFFSLTACSSGTEEVTFEYTNTDIIEYSIIQAYQLQNVSDAYRAYFENSEEESDKTMLTGITNMDNAKEECGEFVGYRSKEDGSSINFDTILNAEDVDAALLYLVGAADATVEENNGSVTVTLKAVYETRDVIYSFVYGENPAYAYAYELSGQSVQPYQIQEVNVTPDYTFGEKMGKAASNTLMGMGTVFLVLIFISIIIAQFERIGKLSVKIGNWWNNRGKKEEESAETGSDTVTVPVAAATANPMDDTQLVAVITAAVIAANSAAGGSDKLIVRSIRKAKR